VPTFELILQVANVINNKILKKTFPNLIVEKIIDGKKDSVYQGGHLLIGTPNSINKGLLFQNNVKMTMENLKVLAIDV
jgi:superfamily II DNA/RNA helicase